MQMIIFQSKNGPDGKWLDYCREEAPKAPAIVPTEEWAACAVKSLSKQVGCEFRYRIEEW